MKLMKYTIYYLCFGLIGVWFTMPVDSHANPILSVHGLVTNTAGAPVNGLEVTVTNTVKNLAQTEQTGPPENIAGIYSVVFIDFFGSVVDNGDELQVIVKQDGEVVAETAYVVNNENITQSQAVINVQLSIAPVLTHVEPDNDVVTGGATVQIVGENFQDGVIVTIGGNGSANVIFVSPTALMVEVPAGVAGGADVVVTNPDGKSDTLEGGFTYMALPVVTGIDPTSGPVTGGTVVTITGENFQDEATVRFGENEATGVSITDTQITATVPAGAAGMVTVTVTNPGGQSAQIEFTYTEEPQFPSYDVNQDGVVNIFDLVLVGGQFGATGAGLPADVTGDGVVNIFDLVTVGGHFGERTAPAAPSLDRLRALHKGTKRAMLSLSTLEPEASYRLRTALTELAHQADANPEIRFVADLLRQWLTDNGAIPTKTQLLPNYPNPFNPETWIPYQLAEAAEVQISIYNVVGQHVRGLEIGFRHAGIYSTRSEAAYWDGRNDSGELVTSGLYFYTFQVSSEARASDGIGTGSFSATRKMLVLK